MRSRAAFTQRPVIRVNELLQELAEQEKRGPEIFPQLMDGWSKEERLFLKTIGTTIHSWLIWWSLLCQTVSIPGWEKRGFLSKMIGTTIGTMIHSWLVWWSLQRLTFCQILFDIGEGSSKRPADLVDGATASKIPKTIRLFTIKSVKQVKVKSLRLRGLIIRSSSMIYKCEAYLMC